MARMINENDNLRSEIQELKLELEELKIEMKIRKAVPLLRIFLFIT